jgi:SulP family sulfate permease
VLNKGGYYDEIGADNVYDSKDEAIASIFEKLDKDICATCTNRIFTECGSPDPVSRRGQDKTADNDPELSNAAG